jgi:hypothetical protein
MRTVAIYVSIVGGISWLFTYFFHGFWQHLAENISFDLRTRFLSAILTQEIGYLEETKVESLPSLVGEYFTTI